MRALLLLALLLIAPSARAHEVGLSRGDYRARPDGVEVEIILARRDAELLASADGDELGRRVLGGLSVTRDARPR